MFGSCLPSSTPDSRRLPPARFVRRVRIVVVAGRNGFCSTGVRLGTIIELATRSHGPPDAPLPIEIAGHARHRETALPPRGPTPEAGRLRPAAEGRPGPAEGRTLGEAPQHGR